MRLPETVRNHPYAYAGGSAFLLAVLALEAVAYAQNPTYDRPDGACASPFAVSDTYVDRDTSTLWQTYTGVNTSGVLVKGTLPEGAYGVEASFAAPGDNAAALRENASDMLKAKSGAFTLKLAIGDGEVQFGLRVVAPDGSELCSSVPDVTFEHLSSDAYGDASGQLPWPNPVNAVVELF
jgi:hypothetical protein